jgi:hypothetical protein
MGEVERQQIELFSIYDHVLAVVTHQIVGGTRDGDPGSE